MLEQQKRVQSNYPIEDRFEEIFDESFEKKIAHPRFGASRYPRLPGAQINAVSDDSMPLFLSKDNERADEQFGEPNPDVKRILSPRTLKTTILAALAAAIIFGLFAVKDTRAVIAAKASLAGELVSSRQASGNPAQAEPPKIQTALSEQPSATALTTPTREQIAMAYQAALQGQQVQPVPQPQAAQFAPQAQTAQSDPPAVAPPVRRLDPDELANLLKRAKGLLAIGDLGAARLLLTRAADAQEAEAALLLASSYDPQVLRSTDARTTSPDPERARFWYRKAAEYGSPDAERRLAELRN